MQVFAQVVKIIADSVFNTADDVTSVLQRVARQSCGGQLQASAAKLDQVADWKSWINQLQLKVKNMTGPGSPHYFKFVRRGDLGMPLLAEHGHAGSGELAVEIEDFPARQRKDPKDVLLVVKAFMADRRPQQVIALAPASLRERILNGLR